MEICRNLNKILYPTLGIMFILAAHVFANSVNRDVNLVIPTNTPQVLNLNEYLASLTPESVLPIHTPTPTITPLLTPTVINIGPIQGNSPMP